MAGVVLGIERGKRDHDCIISSFALMEVTTRWLQTGVSQRILRFTAGILFHIST